MWEDWGKPFPLVIFPPFFYPSIFCGINPVCCDSCQMQMSRPDTVNPQGTWATCSTPKLKKNMKMNGVCVCA